MCGICGIITRLPTEKIELLKKMCHVLKHRGPDDEGIFISQDKKTGLGFRRLSIIDVEGGAQPMCNEDKTVWIVFNGEIYNFLQLRRDLKKLGHIFKTRSDTEVLIHLYEEKKEKLLDEINGMFAFAIWDEKEKKLFLARDRLGKKPLSYYMDSEKFVFASEIKAILQDEKIPRVLEKRALGYYFTYAYTPPPLTMFKKIYKLPAGCYLIYKDGRVSIKKYWDPKPEIVNKPERELEQEIFETLADAVRIRLISDVPIGGILSGGIDSSIVVSLMSLCSRERIKTFTINFEEEAFSEAKYARIIAEKFHTDHHELTVKPEAVKILEKLVWHYDEPFGDSSMLPTYYVCKMASQYVKVALSGDGGDESFAGYPRIWEIDRLSKFKNIPQIFQRFFPSILFCFGAFGKKWQRRAKNLTKLFRLPISCSYRQIHTYFTEDLTKQVFPDTFDNVYGFLDSQFDRFENLDVVNRACYTDLTTYLPYDILVKVDIASMANSLEVRCPFLDYRLVELMLKVPGELKYKGGIAKYILKRAFSDIIPSQILSRGKMGFTAPFVHWFGKDLRPLLHDVILSKRAFERGIFNPEGLKNIIKDFLLGQRWLAERIWLLLVFELWNRIYLDRQV
jgi:asparagine synthase (glutamine-hydrolysing)